MSLVYVITAIGVNCRVIGVCISPNILPGV